MKTKALVSILLHNNLFGIDVQHVYNILRHTPLNLVPRSPKGIAGLINLRGQIVPAMDLHSPLQFPPPTPEQMKKLCHVIIKVKEDPYSLLVEKASSVIAIQNFHLLPTPTGSTTGWKRFCQQIAYLGDEMIPMLNVEALVENMSTHSTQVTDK